MRALGLALLVILGLSGCAAVKSIWQVPMGWFRGSGQAAPPDIDARALTAHVQRLASDEFQGRLPGTRGEDLTVAYLSKEFRRAGLEPGNPDGSFVQTVPLIGMIPSGDAGIEVRGRPVPLTMRDHLVTVSPRFEKLIRVRASDVVFAGYGVQAPEFQWDDFKGLDVRGKTLLVLVNDPPVPLAGQANALDPAVFGGDGMTYYGRWSYKYEKAAELGAAAVLVIHETGPAGYPWEVVSGGWGTEDFRIFTPTGNRDQAAIEGWIHHELVRRVLAASGHDFAQLKAAAARRDFRPLELPAKASFQVFNKLRRVDSRNVVARVRGHDPAVADEYVVYSSHWDHLGLNPNLIGDQIYNGALDNATGAAGLIELGRAFARARPRRSILLLATTAEEQGLLGARYYAQYPL